jgi:S1-C subfamily serine protease
MTRTAVRIAAGAFLVALATGLAIMLGGALVTGDWYALRLPWSDIGMWLITIGLGGGLVFVAAENVVEPVGRWRLLALPGAAIGAGFWFILAVASRS